jgi:outer membrane protein assembly factor BamD
MAVGYYNKGDYHRALQLFDELLIYYRGNDTSEKINYYNAFCYYGQGDYLQAGYYFLKFTTTFPTSKYTEECLYMSAFCQSLYSPDYSLDQTITVEAIKGLQLFVDQYPKSERVNDCNKLIDDLRGKLEKKSYEVARLYLKIESYPAAVISFKNLLREFPDTRFREDAYFYIFKSQYLYATKSVENKKKERFNASADAYNALLSTYPATKYLNQANVIYKNITKELSKTPKTKKS